MLIAMELGTGTPLVLEGSRNFVSFANVSSSNVSSFLMNYKTQELCINVMHCLKEDRFVSPSEAGEFINVSVHSPPETRKARAETGMFGGCL